MSQESVYKIFSKDKERWFSLKEISEISGIGRGTVAATVNRLFTFSFIEKKMMSIDGKRPLVYYKRSDKFEKNDKVEQDKKKQHELNIKMGW